MSDHGVMPNQVQVAATIFPYDEGQGLAFVQDVLQAYASQAQVPNLGAVVWLQRMQYDAVLMGYPLARQKHLGQLVIALGGVPQPTDSPYHVGPGPLDRDRVKAVIDHTAAEYPQLLMIRPYSADMSEAMREFRDRVIWHLRLAGFDHVGRQINPSTLVSDDKISVMIDAEWHAYDIASIGFGPDAGVAQFPGGRPTTVQLVEVGSPNPEEFEGIGD